GYYHQEREDGAVDLRFAIPGGAAQSPADFCRIVFRHNSVYSPAEDGAGDARRLGFAVRSISLSPLPSASAIPDVEDGAPYQDIANGEVVLGPDFSLADGASAGHERAVGTDELPSVDHVRPTGGRGDE